MKDQIDALNDLLEIAIDRKKGYEQAKNEMHDKHAMYYLYDRLVTHSVQCQDEIETRIKDLGGKPTEGGTFLGAIHRNWISIKDKISSSEKEASFESVKFGEKAAITAYEETIEKESIDSETKAILNNQLNDIKAILKDIEEEENKMK